MYICILCPADKIEAARASAQSITKFANHLSLGTPLSPTGNLPITHWFCSFNASEGVYEQIVGMLEHSELVVSGPRAFLDDRELKIIRPDKIVRAKENGEI